MGRAKTTKPVNIDQLRNELELESNPLIFLPEGLDDPRAAFEDDETELEVEVEGKTDAEVEAVLKAHAFDPDFGKPGRATVAGPVNPSQVAAAFDAPVTFIGALEEDDETVVEVAGLSDRDVAAGLEGLTFDPDFGVDPLEKKAREVREGSGTFTDSERDLLLARLFLGG